MWRKRLTCGTYRGTGLASFLAMDHSAHRRPKPKVPEPIEDDPFEMDWPWPGMLPPENEVKRPPAPERSLIDDLDEDEEADEHTHADNGN